MEKNEIEIERGAHGWFKPGERSYAPLMKSEAVKLLAKSFPPSSRASYMYQLQHFLSINNVGPEEFLSLEDEQEIKNCIRRAILQKQEEGHYSSAKVLFYVVRRFLEMNNKDIRFTRTERRALLKRRPKKISRQYIPTREDIYRMADAAPDKGPRQHARAKAIILGLWQSGVRASCMCSWLYGMFRKQLWPEIKVPIKIKIVAFRPKGVTDCAEDTKLSAYNVGYYYTFLHYEAAEALKEYLEERKADGWQPRNEDPVFVTEGTASQGNPIDASHLLGVVKSCAQQIGIDPDTIWTHCFRKAFRKTMYRSGVDPDVAEALMGHKLPGSRGSYFDYHDLEFVKDQYIQGYWDRISTGRIRKLEDQLAELRQGKEKLEANSITKDDRIRELTERFETLRARINGWKDELEERSKAYYLDKPRERTKELQEEVKGLRHEFGRTAEALELIFEVLSPRQKKKFQKAMRDHFDEEYPE